MDLGMVGLDGLVVGSSDSCFSSSDPDHETKLKWYGSGFLKQERTPCAAAATNTNTNTTTEDYWSSRRNLIKVAKTDSNFSANNSKAMLLQQRSPSLMRSNSSSLLSNGQQMLSFSSPNSSQTLTSPYYRPTSTTTYSRNTGYGSEGLNALSMHGVLTGVRGPFTPSQWMELEHQALIYKYITANVPIPSNLLFPIRKALDSVGFSSFSGGPLRPSTLGWGGFHLGFSNNADPEPGRCRRTDGKKWRCSRDAVADQKYCERHMNRGRHRSRKPVEGQSGHSVSGATAGKVIPVASSTAALVAADSLGLKNLQPGGAPNPCASTPHINRIFLDKESFGERIQDATNLSMLSPTIRPKENQFSIPRQHNTREETSRAEFGHVCSDSLLNPLHKSSSLITSRNYGLSQDLNDRENESQRSVRQFMDDWPKTQTNRSAISWPDVDLQMDRTQLSISIPVAASDFMSSASSPANEKLALSPLRLSRELNEPSQRQANWIPISWETSMGGPLGEVLNSTNSSAGECKNSSALNLMTEGWDNSPRLASSPTGVLQKMTFGSLSNSSTGSSPRAENLGSALVNSSLSLPAL